MGHILHSPKHDTFRERVQRVHKLQLGVPSQRYHLVHLLQLAGDDGKAGHELVQPLLAQVFVVLALLVSHLCDLVQLSHTGQVQLLLLEVKAPSCSKLMFRCAISWQQTGLKSLFRHEISWKQTCLKSLFKLPVQR